MRVTDMNRLQLRAAYSKATGVRNKEQLAQLYSPMQAHLLINKYRLSLQPSEADWWYVFVKPEEDKPPTAEGCRRELPEAVVECVVELLLGREVRNLAYRLRKPEKIAKPIPRAQTKLEEQGLVILEQLTSPKELSPVLGCSVATVLNIVRTDPTFPKGYNMAVSVKTLDTKIKGRHLRFPTTEVKAWLASRKVADNANY